jgi:hypothetical protein
LNLGLKRPCVEQRRGSAHIGQELVDCDIGGIRHRSIIYILRLERDRGFVEFITRGDLGTISVQDAVELPNGPEGQTNLTFVILESNQGEGFIRGFGEPEGQRDLNTPARDGGAIGICGEGGRPGGAVVVVHGRISHSHFPSRIDTFRRVIYLGYISNESFPFLIRVGV